MTDKQFIDKYNEDGMVLINNIISPYLVKQFKNEIKIAIQKETKFHGSNKYQDYGMVLCCVKYGGSFFKILDQPFFNFFPHNNFSLTKFVKINYK